MNKWIEGARPKTLSAAVVPVLMGTAVTNDAAVFASGLLRHLYAPHSVIWWRFVAALVVALAIQVGVNYANDYFDGRRGVDTTARRGPRRLTASGLATHKQMKTAIFISFFVAAVAGLTLALATTWLLLLVGLSAFAAALAYSGGPKPYGAAGLGELFVFVFFGIVATMGSTYVQIEQLTLLSFVAAIPVGLLAVCILIVNNVRDIDTDAIAGKRTLVVLLGRQKSVAVFRGLVLLAFGSVIGVAAVADSFAPLLPLLALSLVVKPTMLIAHDDALSLIGALVATARLQLVFGILLAIGLWIR